MLVEIVREQDPSGVNLSQGCRYFIEKALGDYIARVSNRDVFNLVVHVGSSINGVVSIEVSCETRDGSGVSGFSRRYREVEAA